MKNYSIFVFVPNKHQGLSNIYTYTTTTTTYLFLYITLQIQALFIAAGTCPVCIEHSIPTPYESTYSKADVRALGIVLPLNLPNGDFVLYKEYYYSSIVFTFCYDDTASCRTTKSRVHKLIALSTSELIPVAELLNERDLLEDTDIGGIYFYPKNPPRYMLSADRSNFVCTIQSSSSPLMTMRTTTEGERSRTIMEALQELTHVKCNKLKIHMLSSRSSSIKSTCQFTGGEFTGGG